MKSPGDTYCNQIDYIMISASFRNCFQQVKTYRGADIFSDHNPVVMKLTIKLMKLEKKLKLNRLKEVHYNYRYNIGVTNQYNALTTENYPQIDKNEWIEVEWKAI